MGIKVSLLALGWVLLLAHLCSAHPLNLSNLDWSQKVERLPQESFTEEIADELQLQSKLSNEENSKAYRLASAVIKGLARNGVFTQGQVQFWLGWALCDDEEWEPGMEYLNRALASGELNPEQIRTVRLESINADMANSRFDIASLKVSALLAENPADWAARRIKTILESKHTP